MNDMQIDEDYEWGYSHNEHVNFEGNLLPIWNESGPKSGWYPNRATAEEAMNNDLRYRYPTFLIRRPRPAQPEMIGAASIKNGFND